jgi:hypothetical protein
VRTAVKFLAFSAVFSLAVATVYWFLSYEEAGSLLLGFLFLAPVVMGGYLFAKTRRVAGAEDDPNARHPEEAGAALGRFHPESLWPFVMGIGASVGLQGLIYGRWLLFAGAVIVAVSTAGMMRESHG